MRYLALAVDYDGTLATDGRVPPAADAAIRHIKETGRRLILVTGRTLDDLNLVWSKLSVCDAIIAENGGVLHFPATGEIKLLGRSPTERFLKSLREAAIQHTAGQVVIAFASDDASKVIDRIRHAEEDLQIVFNGGSAMLLPPGINKGSGLFEALRQMSLTPHEVAAMGNAENDRVFLEPCECAIAVENAIPCIKEIADIVTEHPASLGFIEISERLVRDDLADSHGRRSRVALAKKCSGAPLEIPGYGLNLLIAGPSGSGKSTFATGLMERLIQKPYQVCVLDPEGDYTGIPQLVSLGDRKRAPSVSEILSVLDVPFLNVSINLLGIPLIDRPQFFAELMTNLHAFRTKTARPHWIFVDEAHHFLPASWGQAPLSLPKSLGETVILTVHPELVAPAILEMMDVAVAIGVNPKTTLSNLKQHALGSFDADWNKPYEAGRNAFVWNLKEPRPPRMVESIPGSIERIRHHRKYADGNLGDKSFYFEGPSRSLRLKAQNLALFVQIAEGVDDDTWLHHLRSHDYSHWLRISVKDKDLAKLVEEIEQRADLNPMQSRALVCNLIHRRYAL